jgi:hypothetical protein
VRRIIRADRDLPLALSRTPHRDIAVISSRRLAEIADDVLAFPAEVPERVAVVARPAADRGDEDVPGERELTAVGEGVAVRGGHPVALPIGFARIADDVFIHGSTGSPWLRELAGGAPAAVSVTTLDGVLVARSGFESSFHYRSAVLFGAFDPAAEPVEVVLAGGCYRLEQTWRFGADDSGYGVRGHFDGRTWPVTWRAAFRTAAISTG